MVYSLLHCSQDTKNSNECIFKYIDCCKCKAIKSSWLCQVLKSLWAYWCDTSCIYNMKRYWIKRERNSWPMFQLRIRMFKENVKIPDSIEIYSVYLAYNVWEIWRRYDSIFRPEITDHRCKQWTNRGVAVICTIINKEKCVYHFCLLTKSLTTLMCDIIPHYNIPLK